MQYRRGDNSDRITLRLPRLLRDQVMECFVKDYPWYREADCLREALMRFVAMEEDRKRPSQPAVSDNSLGRAAAKKSAASSPTPRAKKTKAG